MAIQLLLVDDEERFLNTTRILLAKRGIEAQVAGSALEALKLLDERRFDVVVLDVRMPGMDGLEALRRMRELHPLVEIIMLTGHSSVESAVQGMKLGAFDYLMKPCDLPVLLARAEEAAARKRSREEEANRERAREAGSHPLSVFGRGSEK